MKKTLLIIFRIFEALCVAAVIAGCIFCICLHNDTPDTNDKLYVDRDFSTFSDPRVADGYVYYDCELTVVNLTGEDADVSVAASFEKEKDLGIIDSPLLIGNAEGKGDVFTVSGNGELCEKITFCAKLSPDWDGGALKADRLLPEMYVIPRTDK